jgi:hypothetical protein
MRDQDIPPYDGSKARAVQAALAEARTIHEVVLALNWDRERVRSWVHHLRRVGRVVLVGWTTKRGPNRRKRGVYQRVATSTNL